MLDLFYEAFSNFFAVKVRTVKMRKIKIICFCRFIAGTYRLSVGRKILLTSYMLENELLMDTRKK